MNKRLQWLQSRWLLSAIVVIGIGLRMLAASRGHNNDFGAYLVVADIARDGGNVYAETERYNYGPIWFNALHAIDQAASLSQTNRVPIFRYTIAGLLSLVDVGIFVILLRKIGRLAAYAFFLNPIAIIITGYHSQFDNLALLVGLLSVLLMGDDFEKPLNVRKLIGLAVLGLSLATKHILFAFPLWLAVKQKGLLRKAAVVLVPTTVFVAGFVPYWFTGKEGILRNVFAYESMDFQVFYRLFVPRFFQGLASATVVWLFMLVFFAFVFRTRRALPSLLLYTCVLVVASPAMANQYLAIVVPFISSYANLFFVAYTIIGTWHLLIDGAGFNILSLESSTSIRWIHYSLLISLLWFGFIWLVWRQRILDGLRKVVAEVKMQLEP